MDTGLVFIHFYRCYFKDNFKQRCIENYGKMDFAGRRVYILQTMHRYILILVTKPRYSFSIGKTQTVPSSFKVFLVSSILFGLLHIKPVQQQQ